MVLALTLLTFCLFIILDLIVRAIRARKKKISLDVDTRTRKPYHPMSALFQNSQIYLPKGVFVSRGHVWVKTLPNGEVRTGLDDFCPKLISKIDAIKLHIPGDRVNNNGGMCKIYQGDKKLSFFSPLDGIIKEVNAELQKNPKIICHDPFGEGWIYRIRPSLEISYLNESERLDEEILDWEQKEMERLENFILSDPKAKTELEGKLKKKKFGLKNLLDNLDGFYWLKFEENFLR
jgi:glycine cleavage system H protein